jgi:hypothetical protein
MSIGFPWISLDSLVRIVTYQWVARTFRGTIFLSSLSPRGRPAATGSVRSPCGKRRIVHGRSLIDFPIFCNELSSGPFADKLSDIGSEACQTSTTPTGDYAGSPLRSERAPKEVTLESAGLCLEAAIPYVQTPAQAGCPLQPWRGTPQQPNILLRDGLISLKYP